MGKKKESKRVKDKKKRVNPLGLLESKLPNIPINLYVVVPLCLGIAIGISIFGNIPLALLSGLALTAIVWFGKDYLPEKEPPPKISYTPDDIVMSIFETTWFSKAVPADPKLPEAYSIDGQRWSYKLKFSTDYGDTDIFTLRGSLVTGEAWLEYIEGESSHEPTFWNISEDEKEAYSENENLEYEIESYETDVAPEEEQQSNNLEPTPEMPEMGELDEEVEPNQQKSVHENGAIPDEEEKNQ